MTGLVNRKAETETRETETEKSFRTEPFQDQRLGAQIFVHTILGCGSTQPPNGPPTSFFSFKPVGRSNIFRDPLAFQILILAYFHSVLDGTVSSSGENGSRFCWT